VDSDGRIEVLSVTNEQRDGRDRKVSTTAPSAIDLARQSLKHCQLVLDTFNDVPEVAATSQIDSEPIALGIRSATLLRATLDRGQTIDALELAILFANVDAAAINAALMSETLVMSADSSSVGQTKLRVARALLGNVGELKDSSDCLWAALELQLRLQTTRRSLTSEDCTSRLREC
jgi:hypothetical protein